MNEHNEKNQDPNPDESEQRSISRREFSRLSAMVLGGGAASVVLAACAPTPAAPPTAAAVAAPAATAVPAVAPTVPAVVPTVAPTVVSREPLSIKVLTNWFTDPGFLKPIREVISKFHSSQTDIVIEEYGVPNAQYVDTVTAQMASGKVDADVIIMLSGIAPSLLKGGFLGEVNAIAAKAGVLDTLVFTSVPPYLRQGDKVYGLAPNLAQDGLIYNTEIFKKAGVTPPKTRDEFLALATSLTKRPSQFGFAVRHTLAEKSGFIRDMIPWLLGYDGAYAVGKKVTVNSAPMINVLTMWRNLYLAAFPQGVDAATYRRMMATGILGMNTDNNALPPTFYGIDAKSKEFVNSAPLPWDNHKGAKFSSFIAPVIGGGKDKEQAAATFLEFWFKPDIFKEWNWGIQSPPLIPEADTKEYLASIPYMAGFNTTVGVDSSEVYGDFFPYAAEFTTILITHASEVVVGTKTPEEAAAAAQAELEEMGGRVFK